MPTPGPRVPVALDETTLRLVDAGRDHLKKKEGPRYSRPQMIGRAMAAFLVDNAPEMARKFGIEPDGEGGK